jgi:hypothetical protein
MSDKCSSDEDEDMANLALRRMKTKKFIEAV